MRLEVSELLAEAARYSNEAKDNYASSGDAERFGVLGMKLYDEPLLGFGDAGDPLFEKMKEPGVVGPEFMAPGQWLPGAGTVISFFLPFTEEVKRSNYSGDGVPSAGWLFGRIEGQKFVFDMARHIAGLLTERGYRAIIPGLDERFCSVALPGEKWDGAGYTSNWSERHVAYICGLGTFGLSKGLITEKGMAGRFCSVITDAVFPHTPRAYTGIYDYCTMCGACARRCPAGAISVEGGKDHVKCDQFVTETGRLYAPRYGCGKCQVRVPCESGIPGRIKDR